MSSSFSADIFIIGEANYYFYNNKNYIIIIIFIIIINLLSKSVLDDKNLETQIWNGGRLLHKK